MTFYVSYSGLVSGSAFHSYLQITLTFYLFFVFTASKKESRSRLRKVCINYFFCAHKMTTMKMIVLSDDYSRLYE